MLLLPKNNISGNNTYDNYQVIRYTLAVLIELNLSEIKGGETFR